MKHLLLGILALLPLAAYNQKAFTEDYTDTRFDRSFLYAHTWNLVELNGISTLEPGLKQAYLIFKPGDDQYNRITGYTGCNYIIGRIDLKGADEIGFTPNIITNNNCAGSSVEVPLIQALFETDRWAEKGGQLCLYRKGKMVARFNPSGYTNANLNGLWQLNYVQDHSAPFTELYPFANRPSMMFSIEGNSVSGYSGCKEFVCPVLINNNSMVFANNKAVPDTTCQAKGEYIFLHNLEKVTAYGFKNESTLVLIANSEPVMAFTRIK
ncbi:MAG TPA: META domain-containing protein [Saprospiraceae bacterium]|nr:META domain-containing protein [Saprospiraceae bacterium]